MTFHEEMRKRFENSTDLLHANYRAWKRLHNTARKGVAKALVGMGLGIDRTFTKTDKGRTIVMIEQVGHDCLGFREAIAAEIVKANAKLEGKTETRIMADYRTYPVNRLMACIMLKMPEFSPEFSNNF